MAEQQVATRQLLFRSANTGNWNLDSYLENAEIGNRTLSALLGDIFDSNGVFVANGLYVWKGDWAATTAYVIGDVVRDNTGGGTQDNIYAVVSNYTSAGTIAADISNGDLSLVIDMAAAVVAKTAAEAAQTAAEAALDTFDDTYLGAKASDPTLDNDGDPLATGAIYWNTTSNRLKYYDGAAWQDPQTDAETAETNAQTSETNAATSEANAATSASNAATSETNAAASEVAASAALDLFDDSFLGAKSSDPTLDNDGDPLTTGDTYWNSVSGELKYYNGSSWETPAADAAASAAAASTSETNAATSEANAATSASNASTSETNAATSASNASTSETNASTSETNAATSENTANDWATKTNGDVSGGEQSAKAYAVGGTNVTNTAGKGAAKEWATTTGGTVDTAEFSAKEYAQGTTATGGSAKEWAQDTTAAVDTNFSAKEYAQGSQASTGGSAKNWAQQTGADVTGAAANERSAKSWAQDVNTGATLGGSAKDWAQTAEDTLVDGSEYSAKHYSAKASTSAASITPKLRGYINAKALDPMTTNGCAAVAIDDLGTSHTKPDMKALAFDASADEYCQGEIVVPAEYAGENIVIDIHWYHGATATNFDVVWEAAILAVGNDDTPDTTFTNATNVTDTGGTTKDEYIATITISSPTNAAAGDTIYLRLGRLGTNGSDSLAVDALITKIDWSIDL